MVACDSGTWQISSIHPPDRPLSYPMCCQGHKLRLAMRLADLGFLEKAAQYAESTREEVRLPCSAIRTSLIPVFIVLGLTVRFLLLLPSSSA